MFERLKRFTEWDGEKTDEEEELEKHIQTQLDHQIQVKYFSFIRNLLWANVAIGSILFLVYFNGNEIQIHTCLELIGDSTNYMNYQATAVITFALI